MSLAVRAVAEEQMDADDLDPATYAAVLTDLAKVNRVTLAARPTLAFIARAIGDARRFSLLDVGFGDGDMLRTIARWARARGVDAQLVGVDLNPRSAAVALAATPTELAIDWRSGDYRDQPERFDLIVSSLVAHHMTPHQLDTFLRTMEGAAVRGWFVNDLHRHGFAHRGFPLLARLARWHRMVRHDGTLSIARSFRIPEWHGILDAAGIHDARVFRAFPFRLCVERVR